MPSFHHNRARTRAGSSPRRFILPHRARWEHLSIKITLTDTLRVEGDLPLLQRLELKACVPPRTLPFPHMPLLRAVALWEFDDPPVLLPWSQLTSLTLIYNLPDACTRVTPLLVHANATNIVHGELVMYGDGAARRPMSHWPAWSHWVLINFLDEWSSPKGYFRCLILPALRKLQVPETYLGNNPIATLTLFISGSQCNLREVCITGDAGYNISDETYRVVLPTIPKVSFNRLLTDSYCSAAWGTGGIADFET
ncbi:hypothetical protein B0H19DRAFT_580126 [Mycena capillaripes]|nr:hypothetical protein B0H19DRAFT_580126 [Mycena capillaripes]